MNERIKELMQEKGLNHKEVAEYLNVTVRTVYRYEDGTREPSISVLIKLCDLFEVSADYLIGRTDNY